MEEQASLRDDAAQAKNHVLAFAHNNASFLNGVMTRKARKNVELSSLNGRAEGWIVRVNLCAAVQPAIEIWT